MADHEAIVGQLADITKLITILATDQQKLLTEPSKMASEQTKISRVRERDMQSSSSYQSEMIRKGGEPDYRWSLPLPAPCKEFTGLPRPTSLTSHPSVKETIHHYADRIGVTGEDENATIGTDRK